MLQSTTQGKEGAANALRKLILSALFVSIGVILGKVANIPAFLVGAYSLKIGFGTLSVIMAGVLFGPLYGGMVGGLTDFLQAILWPIGAYQPWFTLVGILFGLIPGLFFMRGQTPTYRRLLLAVASGQIAGSVLLNTLLLVTLYGLPLSGILPARILNQAVMIPLYTSLIYWLLPLLRFTTRSKKD